MDREIEKKLLALEKEGKPLPGIEIQKHETSGLWRWRKHDGQRIVSQSEYKYDTLMDAMDAAK